MKSRNDQSSFKLLALNSRVQTTLLAGLVAVLCYGAANLGGVLVVGGPQVLWPLWPGCALLVAVCLVSPKKIWPILIPAGLAGFVVYDLQAGVSVGSIAWLVLADTLEVIVAAWGVSYALNDLPRLNSLKALARYSFFSVILGSLVVSVIGIHGLSGDRLVSWRMSFLSEGLAFLTVTPAILGWVAHARSEARAARGYYLEVAALIAAVFSLSYFLFAASGPRTQSALLYSLVPFLLWAALRFGSTGVGTSATIIAMVSIWGVIHGHGPFTELNPIKSVTSLQLFLLFTTAPFMVLAALMEEHKQDAQVLRESEKRFRLMADSAPSLIWMSGTDKLCNFFNQQWLEFTGRTMQQELGQGWTMGIHPEDLQRTLDTYAAAFNARVDFEMEYRLRRFDGEFRWLVDYGVPRFEPDGAFCGYIGSCIDITERKTSEEALHALTGRLISAQENERSRIARDLHDDFSQRLALLSIGLGQLWRKLPVQESGEHAKILELLKDTQEIASDLHTLSHQLHSSKLEHVGLVAAINGLCVEINHKYKIEVWFSERQCPSIIPNDVALCLFRVAQEALGNVTKHSGAKDAQVELRANEDGIRLRIADSGKGFDASIQNSTTGIGLVGMSERLRLVGGRFLVTSEPGRGTEIVAEVPVAGSVNELKVKARAAGN
jgi:PAS domain S-box-containing protein